MWVVAKAELSVDWLDFHLVDEMVVLMADSMVFLKVVSKAAQMVARRDVVMVDKKVDKKVDHWAVQKVLSLAG